MSCRHGQLLLAAIGPSGWQVALIATLEIGIAAAITAGIANWLLIRRRRARGRAISGEAPQPATEPAGHRIYVNPWADDENREQPPDRPPDAATPWPVPLEPPA